MRANVSQLLHSDYAIALFPIALYFLLHILGNAVLAGRWRRLRMKPLFQGRYQHVMQNRYWAWAFFAVLAWAFASALWISLF